MEQKNIIGAILSGICLVLVFPKAQIGIIAWIALIPLFMTLEEQTPQVAFRLGLITGLIYFGGTLYWIPYTLEHYGKLPLILSWAILFILVAFLALYVGVFAWGVSWCGKSSFLPAPVLSAVWWVSLEYLRGYILTGFPWVLLGYSQVECLSMIQVAEFTGVYGISFLIVLFNAAAAACLTSYINKKNLPWRFLSGVILLVVLCFAYGMWQLKTPSPPTWLKVSIAQGNIPQDQKWDPKYQEDVFVTYCKLTLQAAQEEKPNLIIWPEAATPFYFQSDPIYRPRMLELAKESKSFLLFGSPGYIMLNKELRPFNGAYMISPQGEELAHYKKIHLVPFGEYVPLEKLFSFAGKLVEQAGNFVSGWDYSLLPFNSTVLGTVICYEAIFPDLVRRFVKSGAEVLVTITNDAWFGRSAAPYQHFNMAALRAVENRRYLVRAANSGISGFFDPWGRVLKHGGLFTREKLTHAIAPKKEMTFYSRFGDVFAGLCLLLVLINFIVSFSYKKRG